MKQEIFNRELSHTFIQISGVIQLSCLCLYLQCVEVESQENQGFMKLLS